MMYSSIFSLRTISILLVCIGLFTAQSVSADSVIRTGDTVSIAGDQSIAGDFYSASGKINLSGSVEGDAIITSSQITINGNIAQDAVLLAGTVDVYGTVGDDLRIVSGETTIAEPVMGDVLVIGGMLTILSGGSVAGDVILLTGQATINGSVGGDILGWSGDLRIDAPVAGDVSVTVNTLTLGDKANITGSVQYVSRELAVQAQGATVEGDLVRNDPVIPVAKPTVSSVLLPILVILFSVLSWYLISRKSLALVSNRALTRSYKPLLFGFATVMLAPFAIIILSVSVIGMLVGIAVFFMYALLLVLGVIAIPAVVGQAMVRLMKKSTKELTLVSLGFGVVGVVLLSLLPLIGAVVLIGVLVLAIGAMIDALMHSALK